MIQRRARDAVCVRACEDGCVCVCVRACVRKRVHDVLVEGNGGCLRSALEHHAPRDTTLGAEGDGPRTP